MRFGFVTCVEIGVACIDEILSAGYDIAAIFTFPSDRAPDKSGRASPRGPAARHDVPIVEIDDVNSGEVARRCRTLGIDWLFIIGWSQIARREVLDAPRLGCVGAHPTLLPAGRGRAAIPWTILKGLSESGVTLFRLAPGVDNGPVLGQVRFPVEPDETATTLYAKVVDAHRELIRSCMPDLEGGDVAGRPQDENLATVWPGRRPEDGRLDFDMTVAEADRLVRATTRPYPGAFIDLPDGRRIRCWSGRAGLPADAPSLPLRFADGTYHLVDWDEETD